MQVARELGMEELFIKYLKAPNKSELLKMKDWAYVDGAGKPVSDKMIQAINDAKNIDFLLNDPRLGITAQKKAYRQQPENWQIDAILWKWGDIDNPVNEIVQAFETELRNRQMTEGSGLPMVDLRHIQKMIESELGTQSGTR